MWFRTNLFTQYLYLNIYSTKEGMVRALSSIEIFQHFFAHRFSLVMYHCYQLTVFIQQELCKIPFNRVFYSHLFRLVDQVLKNWCNVITFYRNLLSHWKCDTIIFLTKLLYLRISSGLLFFEIVRWKSYNHKLILILFVQLLQLSVLGCVTTF